MRFEDLVICEPYFNNDCEINYVVESCDDLIEAMIDIRCDNGFTADTDQNLVYRFILVEWLEKTSVTLHGYVVEANGEHSWYDIEITPEEEEMLIDKLIEKKKEAFENDSFS